MPHMLQLPPIRRFSCTSKPWSSGISYCVKGGEQRFGRDRLGTDIDPLCHSVVDRGWSAYLLMLSPVSALAFLALPHASESSMSILSSHRICEESTHAVANCTTTRTDLHLASGIVVEWTLSKILTNAVRLWILHVDT